MKKKDGEKMKRERQRLKKGKEIEKGKIEKIKRIKERNIKRKKGKKE